MPAAVRSITDERDGLLTFLEQQRYVLRLTAYGLSDEQARHTPTGSELSISALIKHGTEAERFWIERVAGRPPAWSYEGYMAVFRVQPEETITVLLDRHAEVTAATGPIITAVDDLDQQVPFPHEIEWFPQEDFRSVRWVLLHPDPGNRPARRSRRHHSPEPGRCHGILADGRGRAVAAQSDHHAMAGPQFSALTACADPASVRYRRNPITDGRPFLPPQETTESCPKQTMRPMSTTRFAA